MLVSLPTVAVDRRSWRVLARYGTLGSALLLGLAACWATIHRIGLATIAPPGGILHLHGVLLVNASLGSLLCLWRADLLDRPQGYLPPVFVAAGGWAGIAGLPALAAVLTFLGSAGLTGIFIALTIHRPLSHRVLMGAAAAIWTTANAFWAGGWTAAELAPWWASFLVWTVAGVRLELATIHRPDTKTLWSLAAPLVATLAGLIISIHTPGVGLPLVGIGFVGLAGWLVAFDFARDALRAPGLTGFIGFCLLSGFAWLSVAGWALVAGMSPELGIAAPGGWGTLLIGFLGFVVFAHGPIVLTASTDSRPRCSASLYIAPALVHASLLTHLIAQLGYATPHLQLAAGVSLLLAPLFFAAILVLWQLRPSVTPKPPRPTVDTTTGRF